MGRNQELKWLAFSLYPLSFFLYSPFKHLLLASAFRKELEKKNFNELAWELATIGSLCKGRWSTEIEEMNWYGAQGKIMNSKILLKSFIFSFFLNRCILLTSYTLTYGDQNENAFTAKIITTTGSISLNLLQRIIQNIDI